MDDNQPAPIRGIDHGTSHFDLVFPKNFAMECTVTELHHKLDGAPDGSPSFCFVLQGERVPFYGYVSLNDINQALEQIGYRIERLPNKT